MVQRRYFRHKARHRSVRRYRRFRAHASRVLSPIRRFGARIGGGLPAWAKPSRFAAYTGITASVAELVFTPLPDNATWVRYLANGFGAYKESGNIGDILGYDGANDATTIFAQQMKQNALPAVGTLAGFGVVGAVLRYFGM